MSASNTSTITYYSPLEFVGTVTAGTINATSVVTSGPATYNNLTASSAVATDGSKNLVSVTNTGTGNNVLSASPTLTGTISAAAITTSGLVTANAGITVATGATTLSTLTASTALALDGSKAIVSVTNTGTGNNVLSASPTLTGTISAAAISASSTVSATQYTSTISTGTAPLVVASTTNVANLNASSLSGATFASPGAIGSTTASSGAFTTVTASSTVSATVYTSTITTGTAPLVVASTTNVANLNASLLNGSTFALPSPIGSTTPNTGAFTTLSTSGLLTAGAGLTSTAATNNFGATTMSGAIAMGTNKITGLGYPTANTDAASKLYVDTVSQGLDAKDSVRAATTVNGTLATAYENGDVVDGVTLVTGNRILLKNQTDPIENGIYIVAASGAPTRSSDFAAASTPTGAYTFVEEGTVNISAGFVTTAPAGTNTVGTHAMPFTQFSGAGQITAGTGLTKTGNTLSVNASQTQITSVGTLTALTVSPGTSSMTAGTFSTTIDVTGVTTLRNTVDLVGSTTGVISIKTQSAAGTYNFNLPTTSGSSSDVLTSAGGAGAPMTWSSSNGTGNVVRTTSATLITPVLGAATGTSISLTSTASATQYTSTITTGTAPLVVASTTNVANLNASSLSGATFASPGPIGSTTASTGAFSTLSASGLITANAGLTVTGATTSVTTLSASGLVSANLGLTVTGANTSVTTLSASGLVSANLGLTVTGANTSVTTLSASGLISANLGLTVTGANTSVTTLSASTTTASTSNTTGAITTAGGIASSNTTDASSSTNGGSITTAGGLAVAKKVYIGDTLNVTSTLTANNLVGSQTTTATAAGTTILTATSTLNQIFTGTTTQTIQLPNGTTIPVGWQSNIINQSTQNLTVVDAGSNTVATVYAGKSQQLILSVSSVNGIWALLGSGSVTSVAASVPSFLSISGSPITSSGTLAITYSGTALPVANGGTGSTTSTGTGAVVLANTPTLITPVLGAATGTSISLTSTVSATQYTSTITTGTAPLVVASTTNVANLNASSLSGATFASPGPIGSTTASTGAFSTLSASGLITANAGLTVATGTTTLSTLTASTALALDASKGIISVTNTGTGNNVLSASPTLTGTTSTAAITASALVTANLGLTVTGATTSVTTLSASGLVSANLGLTVTGANTSVTSLSASGLITANAGLTVATGTTTLSTLTASTALALDASKGIISVTNTGTGNNVLSASPTLTGTTSTAAITASGLVTANLGLTVTGANTSVTTLSASGLVSANLGLTVTGATTSVTTLTASGLITASAGLTSTAGTTALGVTNLSGAIAMGTNKITGLGYPTASTDAASKLYVDTVAQGLDAKDSVRVATTANGTLATDFENGDTIDGVTLVTGNRILIKNQTNPIENGIYIVAASGAPARSADFAATSVVTGAFTFVEDGSVNSSAGFVTLGTVTVNSDALSFVQFSGAGQITAGTGLTKTGNTLSVNASQTQITTVGTLTALTVTGLITGNLGLTVSGANTSVTTLSASGLITANLGLTVTGATTSVTSLTASSTVSATQYTSTISTGTAPLVVASTTNVANLNASSLSGATFASPGAIGSTTASTGAFTTVTASSTVIASGLVTASAGLSVTGLISGSIYHQTVSGSLKVNNGNVSPLNKAVVLFDTTTDSVNTGTNFYGFGVNNGVVRYQTPASSAHVFYQDTTVMVNIGPTTTSFPTATASTSNTTGAITTTGGISSSNTTDASSSTNGGSFTTAGGLAVAKKVFIGGLITGSLGLTVTGANTSVTTLSASGLISANLGLTVTGANTSVTTLSASGLVTTSAGIALTGDLTMAGSSSGIVSIKTQAAAGTFNFNLPVTAGSTGQVLASDGGAGSPMTWKTVLSSSQSSFGGTQSASNVSVTGLIFTAGSFETNVIVDVVATTNLSQVFKLSGLLSGGASGWNLTAVGVSGDATGVTFSITAGGQIRYSSTAYTGFTSLTITWTDYINASGLLNLTSGVNVSKVISGTDGPLFNVSGATVTDSGTANSGTLALFSANYIGRPTIAATGTSVTTTQANTVFIAGEPIAGTNETITNKHALKIGAGGKIGMDGSTSGTVSITTQAAAGTFNFNLPVTAGSSGQVLASAGGAGSPMTWKNVTTAAIAAGSFAGANNQSSAANITGLVFSSGYFKIDVIVTVVATTNATEYFEVYGVLSNNTGTGWALTSTSVAGDTTGAAITINSSGQLLYTSANHAGFTSITFAWA